MTFKRVLVIGGYSKSLINFRGPLLASMVKAGHEVHAAAPGLSRDGRVYSELRSMGIHPHGIYLQRTGLSPVADFRSLLSLWGLMRKVRPHTVLAYTIKPVVWGGLAARMAAIPEFYALITGLGYSFSEDAGGKRALVRKLAQTLYRISLTNAAGIMFQNHDDPVVFRDGGLLPSGIIPVVVNGSGVDLDKFLLEPLPAGPCRFVMVSRLLGSKGVREYAEAASILRAQGVVAQLDLVGGPDSTPDSITSAQAQAWHDDGRLHWYGSLEDVRPVIRKAHVVVLPSCYREGTPRSVLEGMAMGRAVITTDVAGCRETVVHGENGFLIPPQDSMALATAMRRCIDDPSLVQRMGKGSYDIAQKKYDAHKVNAEMLRVMKLE